MTIDRQQPIRLKRRLDEAVYDEMLNEFLRGHYGEMYEFNPSDIAEHYGVSMTPIMLTLKRLYNERLIERSKSGKYHVPRCEAKDVHQICDVRLMLEQKCFEHVMETGNPEAVYSISSAAQICKKLVEEGDKVGFMRADIDFHRVIVDSYDNDYISMLYRMIRNKMITWHSNAEVDMGYLQGAAREHVALVDALDRRDSSAAAALLEHHVNSVRDKTLEHIAKRDGA